MRIVKLVFSLSILVFVLGCATSLETPLPQASVNVQLKWAHQAQFAGFYVAEEQGFYAEENLDVELVSGGIDIDIFEGVTNGDIDFAVVGADRLITNIHDGAPLVALATTYRINPFILVAFQDSDINSPRDFVGKTLSVTNNGYDELQVSMMLGKVGVDSEDVNIVPYDSESTQSFIDGEIDIINSFAAGGFFPLRDAIGDRPVTIFWPGDYGVNFYSDTIVTNLAFMEEHPDVVLRFLRATLKGHQVAVEQPDVAIASTMKYADVQDEDVQSEMLMASIPLIHTGDSPIGVMDPAVWEEMQASMVDFGIIGEAVDPNRFFTLEFLETIYGDSS